MARDVKEKKCGCIVFEVGPPVLCDKHQFKEDKKAKREERKAAREVKREEKGLRKLVLEQAAEQGHDVSRFKEYQSRPGKWVAHCHNCGTLAIVYDRIPEYGDQVNAAGLFVACRKSDLVGTLGAEDRDAFKRRFENEDREEGSHDPEPDDDSAAGDDDAAGVEP